MPGANTPIEAPPGSFIGLKAFALVGDSTIARNSALNLAAEIVPLILAAATIPLLLARLGAENFGLLVLSWTVVGLAGSFDLGVSRATGKFAAECVARGELDRVASLIWSSSAILLLAGVLGASAVGIVAPRLLSQHLKLSSAAAATLPGICLTWACYLPLVFCGNSWREAVAAKQRFDILAPLKALSGSLTYAVPLVASLLGAGIVGLVNATLLSRALVSLGYLAACARIYPGMLAFHRVSPALGGALLRYGGWLTIVTVCAPMLWYMDRFFIGVVVSVAAVSEYAIASELTGRLMFIPASLVAVLFPAFSGLHAAGDRAAAGDLLVRWSKYLFLVLAPVIGAVVVLAPALAHSWLGFPAAAEVASVFRLLACAILVSSIAYPPYTFLQASGRPEIPSISCLAQLPLYAALSWFLTSADGIRGAAAAWLIRALVDAAVLWIAVWRLRVVDAGTIGSARLMHTLLLLSSHAAVIGLAEAAVPSLSNRIAIGAASLLLTASGLWWFSLTGKERAFARAVVGPLAQTCQVPGFGAGRRNRRNVP